MQVRSILETPICGTKLIVAEPENVPEHPVESITEQKVCTPPVLVKYTSGFENVVSVESGTPFTQCCTVHGAIPVKFTVTPNVLDPSSHNF